MTAVHDAAPADSPIRPHLKDAPAPGLPKIPLPEFVTPEWLGKQYSLTPGDIRRLSKVLADHYADWPTGRLDRSPEQFFIEIHRLAQDWPYLFLDLSLMIEAIVLGRKSYSITRADNSKKPLPSRKLCKKCMLWSNLTEAMARCRETEGGILNPSDGDYDSYDKDNLFESMQSLIDETDGPEKSELCWIMNFFCLASFHWGDDPEIDERVRLWVRTVDCSNNVWPYQHLFCKLLDTPTEPVLSTVMEEAQKLADRMEQKAVSLFRETKTLFLKLDDARTAFERDSFDGYLQMEDLFLSTDALRDLTTHVLAAGRTSELHQLLASEIADLVQNGTIDEEAKLCARLDALGLEQAPPLYFPDPEWERCREQIAAFRSVSKRAHENQTTAKAAAQAFAVEDTPENFNTLTAAIAAAQERVSVGSLFDALDTIEIIVLGLRDGTGEWLPHRDRLLQRTAFWFGHRELGESSFPKRKDRPGDDDSALPEAELLENERKRHLETSEQLAHVKEELERTQEAAENDRRHLDDELSKAKTEIYRLTELLDRTGAEAAKEKGVSIAGDMTVPLPEDVSYAGLPGWTAQHFSGRIGLHQRALRSLEEAQFSDVELAYRSVELLGTLYWKMRTRSNDTHDLRKEYDAALERLFLEDTQSASESAMGMARDSYERDWNGRRLTMDRHLKNRARGRDPRRCFRLYFTWDEASRLVVIGHLPGHLRTRTS